jgi:hypothetical protein
LDFKETFGTLRFISAIPVYEYFDNKQTDTLEGYRATITSERLNELYTISINDLDSKVLSIRPFSVVELLEPTAQLYVDNSQVERGSLTVSLKAQDLVVAQNAKIEQKPTEPKPQPTKSNENK